ncbi:hypothetical protein E2C01_049889 [Portunus trituberculatus]|uniref:Uncharacterized protein n=1 Tax=Portunus trituberculatus TaxID=210409 RepID=A0A5B7G7K1_PORTR|nr:hypothetical protein [Portunus trituberculatus]
MSCLSAWNPKPTDSGNAGSGTTAITLRKSLLPQTRLPKSLCRLKRSSFGSYLSPTLTHRAPRGLYAKSGGGISERIFTSRAGISGQSSSKSLEESHQRLFVQIRSCHDTDDFCVYKLPK